jgi:hypothetical protein
VKVFCMWPPAQASTAQTAAVLWPQPLFAPMPAESSATARAGNHRF